MWNVSPLFHCIIDCHQSRHLLRYGGDIIGALFRNTTRICGADAEDALTRSTQRTKGDTAAFSQRFCAFSGILRRCYEQLALERIDAHIIVTWHS